MSERSRRDFLRRAGTAAAGASVATIGYPGPMTPAVREIVTTVVIPDMFTRAARGQDVNQAVSWATGEIRRIYAKYSAG